MFRAVTIKTRHQSTDVIKNNKMDINEAGPGAHNRFLLSHQIIGTFSWNPKTRHYYSAMYIEGRTLGNS